MCFKFNLLYCALEFINEPSFDCQSGMEAILKALDSNGSLPVEELAVDITEFNPTVVGYLAHFISNSSTLQYLSLKGKISIVKIDSGHVKL